MAEQFWLCDKCRKPHADEARATACEALHIEPDAIVGSRWAPPELGFHRSNETSGVYPVEVTLAFGREGVVRRVTYRLRSVGAVLISSSARLDATNKETDDG